MLALQQLANPGAQGLIPSIGLAHDGVGALDEEPAQVDIAPLADAQQDVLTARGMLARHQPQRGREVSTAGKLRSVPDIGRHRTRGDGADAGDAQQAVGGFLLQQLRPQ